jgi:hypothetical protein
MGPIRRLAAFFGFALAAATPAAASDPFVTVRPDPNGGNSAFWILPMDSRPDGGLVAMVSLDRINAALPRTEARWCAAEPFTAESFTSRDAAVRAEIRQYLRGPRGNLFQATTGMTGRRLVALVGNARTCAGRVAPFLLLVDNRAHVPRIVYVRTFADWTPFIVLHAEGDRLIVSSCLECDHAEVLTFNRRTRRFAWRSGGP